MHETPLGCRSVFDYDVIAEYEYVDTGAEKTADRVFGGVHNGFAHDVEGGVDHNGYAAKFFKFGDHLMVAGENFLGDGLYARGAVHMGDGGEESLFFFHDGIDEEHEGGVVAAFKILVCLFL